MVIAACGSSSATSSNSAASGSNKAQQAPLTHFTYALPSQGINTLPQLVALDRGYFKQNGLDVTIATLNGGPAVLAAVQSGSVQAAVSSTSVVWRTAMKNVPIQAVAVEVKGAPYELTFSKKSAAAHGVSPTTSVTQAMDYIHGLTIGGLLPGSTEELTLAGLLKQAGKDMSWVKPNPVHGNDAELAALQHGEVDAIMTPPPAGEFAETSGFGQIIFSAHDVPELKNFINGVTVVNPEYAKSHPDVVKSLVKALGEAQAWITSKPKDAAAFAVQKIPGLTSADALEVITNDGFSPTAAIDPQEWVQSADVSLKYGLITSKVPSDILAATMSTAYS